MALKRRNKYRRNYCLLAVIFLITFVIYLVFSSYSRKLHSGHDRVRHRSPEVTKISRIVHFLWCGNRTFEFRHYLSVLSAIRFSRAKSVRVYCNSQPKIDHFEYNTWFKELLEGTSMLRVETVPFNVCKNESTKLKYIKHLIRVTGGIFIGHNTILTRPLQLDIEYQGRLVSSYEGYLVSVVGATPLQTRQELLQCIDEKTYSLIRNDNEDPGYFCLYRTLFPKDLITPLLNENDKFLILARKLFYRNDGSIPRAKAYPSRIVPNIAHQLWISLVPMDFLFYLSSLSLLNVVGVDRLYIYGERTPGGRYWKILELNKRVTFITIPRPDTAYNKRTGDPRLVSDIFRAEIMMKYGGIYSDVDVIWTRRPPEHFWKFEATASLDWAHSFPPYPDYMNLGVAMACDPSFANSGFWKLYAESLKDLRDGTFGYNGLLQPYKIYERNPSSVLIDNRLQVMCFKRRCYPRWGAQFSDVKWSKDISAVHWTWPTPIEFANPKTLLSSNGTWAEIGKYVLQKTPITNL